MAHLILVGLPGAGKTHIGRLVAERLGRRFVDLDQDIERREGQTVAQIFASNGEEYFRRVERQVTAELQASADIVLAPGGGWMLDQSNVARLRPPGRLVYLRVSPEEALRRMGPSLRERPLLASDDPLRSLRELYRRREAKYMTADLVVDTEVITEQELVSLLADYCSAMQHA